MRRLRLSPLRRLVSLSAGELADLLWAQYALMAAQLRVWTMPRGSLVGVGDETSLTRSIDARSLALAERRSLAVRRAAAYGIFRPQCLVQALALSEILHRDGVRSARVRVGVRHDARGFAAHAWVELAGHPLGERPELVGTLVPLPDARVLAGR